MIKQCIFFKRRISLLALSKGEWLSDKCTICVFLFVHNEFAKQIILYKSSELACSHEMHFILIIMAISLLY